MKAAKKIMASALALTMAASAGIGALADTISASGGDATVPVTITSALKEGSTAENPQYEAPVLSVTLPASLPLTINANGSVNAPTADAFKITNGSAGPVKVSNVEFVNGTDWSFVPYEGSDFASMQVDSHKLGLSLTASDVTVKTGDEGEALKPNWTIAKDGSLPITAAAAASAVSQTVTEESAASVVFTVGWDAVESASTPAEPAQTTEPAQTISFTIKSDGYCIEETLNATAGQTWAEWLADSSYAHSYFHLSDDGNYIDGFTGVTPEAGTDYYVSKDSNGDTYCLSTEVIESGAIYYFMTPSKNIQPVRPPIVTPVAPAGT